MATPQILSLIEKETGHISFHRIQEFIRTISPNMKTLGVNLFQSLFKAICDEYSIRLNFGSKARIEDITSHILAVASKVNQQLCMALRNILNNQMFMQSVIKGIPKNQTHQNSMLINTLSKDKTSTSTTQSYKPFANSAPNKSKSPFNFEAIRGPNRYQQSNSKMIQNKQIQTCQNLKNRPQCICLNQREIVSKDQTSFRCIHCFRLFHTLCFRRKSNAQSCPYCYIEKMFPLKRVVKTAYLGLLRKNTKKHTANFIMPHIEQNQKVQIRCLRLKEGAQNSCLFPDVAEILINSHRVKQFEPINKLSCLKYRKDQPFMLLKGDYFPAQENNLLLNETLNSHKEKQIRYESQNHIFGIFVVQDLKIQTLVNQIKEENVLGFSESKEILNDILQLDQGEDEISLELVRIPLSCPLTSLRIDIPARGIFCTHFQCFDLKNYLTLISQSQNPRWKCPLCPNLAYQLQIDSITQQILKQNKHNQKIQQILFFKNGDYTLVIDDEPVKERKSIQNLEIPQKKSIHEPPPVIEEAPFVKKQFQVPVHAYVINLDD